MDEKNFYPYFAQEQPEMEIIGMIADEDISEAYELDACAVFKTKKGYLVVFVSGCSCWPQYGSTTQVVCNRKVDVDKQLRGVWSVLLDKCQARNWKVQ